MAQTSNTLVLTIGSADPIWVRLRDEQDKPLDMSGVSDAEISVKDGFGASTPMLSLTLTAAEVAIDAANHRLVGTVSQIKADALVVGQYIGQARVKYTATNKWRKTAPFTVRIDKALL